MQNMRKLALASAAIAAFVAVAPLAQAAQSVSPQNMYQSAAPGSSPATNTASPNNSRTLTSGAGMGGSAACPFKEDALGIWHDGNGRVATMDTVRKANCHSTGSTSNNAGNPGNAQEGSGSGSPVSR